ncbi:MAG: phosphoribosylaminoimidazolesuccinocarboxamide synthase [Chloroflexota bacterium]|nr:phosphoribosylaminoimidazolesuccinocarboxamide synthase [Chloroflexota bacterium]
MLLNQLIKDGKGKTVFSTPDARVLIQYKDTITGHSDGISDPGGNRVIGAIPDSSHKYLNMTLALYQIFEEAGIRVAQWERISIDQIKVEFLDLIPVEVICRNRATGSFLRRYGPYVREGQALRGLIEFTLKNDSLGDPLIVEDALVLLGFLNRDEIHSIKSYSTQTNDTLQTLCASLGIELWDFKLEFGRRLDGTLVLRDELSTRTARFYRNGSLLGIDELYNLFRDKDLVA